MKLVHIRLPLARPLALAPLLCALLPAHAAGIPEQWQIDAAQAAARHSAELLLIVHGIVLGVVIGTLFQLMSDHRRISLHALLMAFGTLLTLVAHDRTLDAQALMGDGTVRQVALIAGLAIFGAFGALFSIAFLAGRPRSNTFRFAMMVLAAVAVVAPALSLALPQLAPTLLALPVLGLLALTALLASVVDRAPAPGSQLGFQVGWLMILLGVATEIGRGLAAAPISMFTVHALQITFALGMLALAASSNCAHRARERVRIHALEESLAVQAERVAKLEASEQNLARNLGQRSRELELMHRKLIDANDPETGARDPITGLVSRLILTERISHGLMRAKRHNVKLALIAVEIDGFADLTRDFGRNIGDELLVAVSRRLSSLVRADDTVARLSDSEFVITLEDVFDVDDIMRVKAAIEVDLLQPFKIQDHKFKIAYLTGHAFYPESGHDAAALLSAAERMMNMNGAQSDLRLESGFPSES